MTKVIKIKADKIPDNDKRLIATYHCDLHEICRCV